MLKKTVLLLTAVFVFSGVELAFAQMCTVNKHCSKYQYCKKATGDCDGIGTCQWKPEACLDVYNPVCGCDGETYSNACYAALNGVSLDSGDACQGGDRGTCTVNKHCPRGQYCRKAPGDCDGIGTCSYKPDACLDVWRLVCGCDGQTYSNACYAALDGVNVDYGDACEGERGIGDPCQTNADCGWFLSRKKWPLLRQYCKKDVGDCDGEGVCAYRPQMCLDVWIPVCGCDGNTYSNHCYAARVGVNVDYADDCGSTRSTCQDNGDCGFREYCKKAIGDCDGDGVCSFKPRWCLDVWIPVCGCDGNHYSNTCYAARAGMNVYSIGYCPW